DIIEIIGTRTCIVCGNEAAFSLFIGGLLQNIGQIGQDVIGQDGQEGDICDAHLERAPYARPAPVAEARVPPIDISRNAHLVEYGMALQAARRITNQFNTRTAHYAEAIARWNRSTITYTPGLETAGRTHISIDPVLEFGPLAVQSGEVTLTIGHELGHQLYRFRMMERNLGVGHRVVEDALDQWSRCNFID
ncbi:MAG: hypothetical protein ACXIVO_02250, partial [Glycocaulis sp.]